MQLRFIAPRRLARSSMRALATLATIAGLSASPAAHAGPYSALYVFGDSLSDNGSDFALSSAIHALNPAFPIVPAAPGSSGHFSNGAVAVDYLAQRLGLPLTPHYLTPPFLGGATGGTNYAQGGATSGTVNASLPGTLQLGPTTTVTTGFNGVTSQVADYRASTAVADPNALYIVWGGANDFVHLGSVPTAPGCGTGAAAAVCTAVTNIANAVAALASIGAMHILVPNLPDLGMTASSIAAGPATQAGATALAVGFNTGLASAIGTIDASTPGDVRVFDLFSLFNQILANPLAYGFTNTMDQCLVGSAADATATVSAACAAAGINSYIFWDGIHPTTHAHEIIGAALAVAAGVPEPEVLALLAIGAMALALRRRAGSKAISA